MSKVFLLGANVKYDTDKQVVEKNQIIQMNGYEDDRYVVYDITGTQWGLSYELINLRTKTFGQCDLIRPLSQKFGIGYYFDDENPQFMDAFEVAILRSEAERNRQTEQAAKQQQQERDEQLKAIGRERLEAIVPDDVQAVIVAELHEDESDGMTDYYGYRTQRTVILGFSAHTRDLFPEMRKVAANFEETAHLAEENRDYEHREKYSMGAGYYLGESKYHGWTIQKERYGSREQFIERYALTAGEEANICVKVQAEADRAKEAITGDFVIVDYSEKALAVFGDTRQVKDRLKALGGRFNPKLTHGGTKKAGWIFSKSKEQEIKNLLTVK
ncbi:MAG: fusion protein [Bacteroidales bacterium]|nr:fusion protein [Bacteroidales bacterium]